MLAREIDKKHPPILLSCLSLEVHPSVFLSLSRIKKSLDFEEHIDIKGYEEDRGVCMLNVNSFLVVYTISTIVLSPY